MNNTKPLVTIAIPTYNSGKYLVDTFNSIVAQSYKNIEVIVSDNASTDSTNDIIQEYALKYNWKHLKNDVNIGAFQNFNKLINSASGEYLAIYHSDDVYARTIVEESVNILEAYDQLAFVGTLSSEIDEKGEITGHCQLPPALSKLNKSIYDFEEVFQGVFGNSQYQILLVTPSIMVKREVFASMGGFLVDSKYGSAGDYEMWLRIARHHPIAVINKPLMGYRVHMNQGSQLEIRENIEIPDLTRLIQDNIQWITNKDLVLQAKSFIRESILIAALKQNSKGYFTRSNETLRELGDCCNMVRRIITCLNNHKISIHYESVRFIFKKIKSYFTS